MFNANREEEAQALLSSLTIEQLHAGLKRGRDQLLLVDAMDAQDDAMLNDDIGHPGRHPSASYEAWAAGHSLSLRSHLQTAIADTEAEIRRRGETP